MVGAMHEKHDTTPMNHAGTENPVRFIHECLLQDREVYADIEVAALAETPRPETASRLAGYLRNDLPLHLDDRETDLFPLLKRRCTTEDQIDRAIGQLVEGHAKATDDRPAVLSILDALASEGRIARDAERDALMNHAAGQRRILIFEAAIILPFARLRLTRHDLETLRLCLSMRRGA